MIQQRSDCLVFETDDGQCIPCSAEELTIELVGKGSKSVTPELIHNAASALLHYFKNDLGREKVSIGEFTEALVTLLQKFGYQVTEGGAVVDRKPTLVEVRLETLVEGGDGAMEMAFFNRLRTEVRKSLGQGEVVLRMVGLRGCVKQLSGSRRWNGRCRELSDQIVEFLRQCVSTDVSCKHCELIIQ